MARVSLTLATLRARAAGRHAPPPPRPVEEPDAEAELLSRAPGDDAFLTGNGIAWRCGWIRNYGRPLRNPAGHAAWCFCKTDHVDWFFAHEAPQHEFVLVSHNSDIEVGERFARHLRDRRLRAWLAANAALAHPKLRPLPLGIANPRWPHGDVDVLRRVQHEQRAKGLLFDVSFSVATNAPARRGCLEQTGLELLPPLPFPAYLERLASAYFSICPPGNGIDTHRVWESLYLRTVPVVIRSPLTEAHPDLPLVVLDDWSELRARELSPQDYDRIWRGWDPRELAVDRYLARFSELQ